MRLQECPNCQYGIQPSGSFCDCQSGQQRKSCHERRLSEEREQRAKKHNARQQSIASRMAEVIPAKYAGFDIDGLKRLANGDTAKLHTIGVAQAYGQGGCLDTPNGLMHSLCLWGGVGTGKTSLAMEIAKQFIARGKTVYAEEFYTLVGNIQRTFRSSEGSAEEIIQRAQSVDLLVLDDFGSLARPTVETPWRCEVAARILNSRFNHNKPTVITTNLTVGWQGCGIEQQFGERIASRVFKNCADIQISGRDMRYDR